MARNPTTGPIRRGWFQRLDDSASTRLRLLCFPPLVAAEARFADWRGRLPDGVEIGLFDPLGQGGRGAAPAGLAEMAAAAAAEIAALPKRLLLLFGHREGAVHAFETARALECGHGIVPERLFLSGWPAPDAGRAPVPPASDAALIERLRSAGTPQEALDHSELSAVILARLRHALALIAGHRPSASPAPSGPATLVYGEREPLAGKEEMAGWGRWLGPVETLGLAGGGEFLVARETEIVAAVAAAAVEALNARP